MDKKICFIITPIGEEGSDVRKNADALFKLAIKPALNPFNFEVIRADTITSPSSITSDVIKLIQTADLCIADLTGHNPNVFYEIGRRHETAKPLIQVAKKGEPLPFDIKDYRTIFYEDLSLAQSVFDFQEALKTYVDEYEKKGYGDSSKGDTLADIYEMLQRIDRKISSLSSASPASGSYTQSNADEDSVLPFVGNRNPLEQFVEYTLQGDVARAEALIPRMKKILTNAQLVVPLLMLAPSDSEYTMNIIEEILLNDYEEIDSKVIDKVVGVYVSYYGRRDEEKLIFPKISPVISKSLERSDLEDEARASLLNQLQRLHFGMGDYQKAFELGEQVLALSPNEPGFNYNMALNSEKLKFTKKAVEYIDKCINLGTQNIDHLESAIRIHMEYGDRTKIPGIFQQIKAINPGAAKRVLTFNSELKDFIR